VTLSLYVFSFSPRATHSHFFLLFSISLLSLSLLRRARTRRGGSPPRWSLGWRVRPSLWRVRGASPPAGTRGQRAQPPLRLAPRRPPAGTRGQRARVDACGCARATASSEQGDALRRAGQWAHGEQRRALASRARDHLRPRKEAGVRGDGLWRAWGGLWWACAEASDKS
jgi:hypothetical protein